MRPQTLTTTTIKPPPHLPSMPDLPWGVFQYAKAFCFMVVLVCTLSIMATCEPCSTNGLRNQVEYVGCGSLEENSNTDYQSGFAGGVSSADKSQNAMPKQNLDNVCPQSNLFCFRSTLPGFKSSVLKVLGFQSDVALLVGSNQVRMKDSWSSGSGRFKLSGGRTISCSLSYQDSSHGLPYHHTRSSTQDDISSCRGSLPGHRAQDLKSKEHTATVKSAFLHRSSRHVEIRPTLLDWGQQDLYFPSSAFLSVRNTHSDQILNVYEPYSTSSQFYPCNFSEISLAPGEVASICFVFLPIWVGLSSAQLVLQTSGGGFLIHAKGLAVESPYGIQPLVGLDVSTNGKWSNNLSLFNPFNEAIFVEELTAWMSVSSGNTSSLTRTICSINSIEGSSEFRLMSVKEWLNVRSNEVDLPIVALRPHTNWEVAPGKSQTIMELDFSYHSEGKIFGAFCMQLLSSSKKKVNTVMVPLEVEWSSNSASDELISPVSVSLEALMPCESNGTVVAALSIKNNVPYLLSVVKISVLGGNANLSIKYIKGLILFPSTNTQVAVVTYTTLAIQKADPLHETPEIIKNCKLSILTNDSRSSPTEIPCEDVITICSRHYLYSSVGYQRQSEGVSNDNSETGHNDNMDSGRGSPPLIKALDTTEADEFVLRNWKSQATASDMSIVDDHEVVFPTVLVGSYFSQWITVKNPSQHPVVMQLILNSAEIVDECRAMGRLLLPSSSSSLVGNKSVAPVRYGFSIAESAMTEALVHPYGRALLGPIFFQPSDRCEWKSSALIRNNLSGVEWLSLQGFGGSLSLVLLEESEPLQILDFKLNPLNFSPHDMYHMLDKSHPCSQPSLKELHARNTGDLPLEVKRIEVSGTECGLDGFLVHTCKGFALEPGQSKKLIISYQTDFSAATLHRELELALTTGILVIPMKASVSMHMFNICKRSMFWTRVKKSIIAVFLAASILFIMFSCILPNLMAFGSQVYLFKNGKGSTATVGHLGKSSCVHCIPKKGNQCSITSQMNGSLKSIGEEKKALLLESMGGYPDPQVVSQERNLTFSLVNPMPGYPKQTNSFLDIQKETISPSSAARNSEALDSSNMQEALQENLKINIENGKRRRRRKKRSTGAGLAAAFEVSSSHSGNSTPSSPLSPVTSVTPTRLWQLSPDADQSCQSRKLFAQVADLRHERRTDSRPASKVNVLEPEMPVKYVSENWCSPTQEMSTVPRKIPGKPVLLPSVTVASAGTSASDLMNHPPLLVPTSKIAPHARAPGSKLHDQKAVRTEEKTGFEEKFTYDIWGNHLFGQPPIGQSTDVSKKQPHATENNSDSFFVRDPQTLIANSQQKPVSFSYQVG